MHANILVSSWNTREEKMSAHAIGRLRVAIGSIDGSVQRQTDPVYDHGNIATRPFGTSHVTLVDLLLSDPSSLAHIGELNEGSWIVASNVVVVVRE